MHGMYLSLLRSVRPWDERCEDVTAIFPQSWSKGWHWKGILPWECFPTQHELVQSIKHGLQDTGKKQVAAILGVQSSRAKTQPRPFLRLQPQRIAVQAWFLDAKIVQQKESTPARDDESAIHALQLPYALASS